MIQKFRILCCCFYILLLGNNFSQAQKFEWAEVSDAMHENLGYSMIVDQDNNIYVSGYFVDTLKFNQDTLVSWGPHDFAYIAKYDIAGTPLWAKKTGILRNLGIDENGFLYMTGSILGLGDSIQVIDTIITATQYFALVAKIDSSGTLAWMNQYMGPFMNADVNYDNNGCLIWSGYYVGSVTICGTNLFGNGEEIFVSKLDTSGNCLWAKSVQVSGNLEIKSDLINTDDFGNIIMVGKCDSISLDTIQQISMNGAEDIFIFKMDSAGNALWCNLHGSASSSSISVGGIEVDSNNNSYVVGTQNNGVWPEAFVSKYNIDGILLWNETFQSDFATSGGNIEMNSSNKFIIEGGFTTNINFNGTVLNNDNSTAQFIACFDTSGDFNWVRSIQNSSGGGVSISGISTGNSYFYFIGILNDTVLIGNIQVNCFVNPIGVLFAINTAGASVITNIPISNFSSGNTPEIKSNEMNALSKTTSNTIYFATRTGGVVVVDGVIWRSYCTFCPNDSSLTTDSVNWIFTDIYDSVWVCTENAGVFKIDTSSFPWPSFNTANSGIASNRITCGAASGDTLAFGTAANGVSLLIGNSVWDSINTLNNSFLPSDSITVLLFDAGGGLWIGTNGKGLARWDGANLTVFDNANSGLPDDTVQCLAMDTAGTLWVGTRSNGLGAYDTSGVWRMYNSYNTILPDNNIKSIIFDQSGVLLAGTNSKGVGVFDGVYWDMINDVSGMPDTSITALLNVNGIIWGGTRDSGIFQFDYIPPGPIGIEEAQIQKAETILVYPNPSSGKIFINMDLVHDSDLTISFFNSMGQHVMSVNANQVSAGKNVVVVDGSSLAEGIYIVRMKVNDAFYTRKIIISGR